MARCAFGAQWSVARRCKFGNAQHGTAWHDKFNEFSDTAQQIQRGKPLRAKQCVATLQIQHEENGAVLAGKAGKAKMGQCLGGGLLSLSLSLSRCSHFWHAFGLNLKGFFTHFVVVLFRFILDFAHFIAILSHLVANFSYFIAVLSRIFVAFSHLFAIAFRFIIVLTHLFTYKRHFLEHCAFLKFLNALFVRFCVFFVILSVAKNPQRLKENLPFLDTSLSLSMTNSGFCLKTTGKENTLCHLEMTADFVILSVATQRVARCKPHKSALNSLLKLNFRLR